MPEIIRRVIALLIAKGALDEAQELWALWNQKQGMSSTPAPELPDDPWAGDPYMEECEFDKRCSHPRHRRGCSCGENGFR